MNPSYPFICEDVAFDVRDYTFNSYNINCGTPENNLLLKGNELIIKFKYSALGSPPEFWIFLYFNSSEEAPYTHIEGTTKTIFSEDGRQEIETPYFTGFFNQNSNVNITWETTGFCVSYKRLYFCFYIANEQIPFLVIPRIYLITEKNETTGEVSKTKTSNVEQIPKILIRSQYLIDISDIGDTTFEILDKFSYYCKDQKQKNIIQNLKITFFQKSCPKIVSVLKGIGITAIAKVNHIYEKYNISLVGIDFYDNLVEYSMVKYLLSKILYNKLNIKYLLNKYYIPFINNLSKSRFNHFVDFFTNPESKVYNYNQYFLNDFN